MLNFGCSLTRFISIVTGMIRSALHYLRSLRLTLVLLAGLAVLLGLDAFPGGGLQLIGTPLFWLIIGLLGANTAACTGWALWHRPPTRLLNWGPHLIHLGLLFLLAGLVLSLLLRHEETVVLEQGQTERLQAGIILQLTEAREVRNDRGDLVNWESRLKIQAPGQEPWQGTTAVNRPLRIPPYRLYQTDFETRPAVRLLPAGSADGQIERTAGTEVVLAVNEGYRENDTLWVLSRDDSQPGEPDSFFFLGYRDGQMTGRRSLQEGAESLGLEPLEATEKTLSGLRLSYDPGALPAAAGALLLGFGVILYGIERYRRRLA